MAGRELAAAERHVTLREAFTRLPPCCQQLIALLTEDPPEDDRRAFIERLRTQLGRIQWLVATLLKLARLDAGTAVQCFFV